MHPSFIDIAGWSYILLESVIYTDRLLVVIGLFLLSMLSLYMMRLNVDSKVRLTSLYAHVLFLALIPTYLVFAWSCPISVLDCPHRLLAYSTIPIFVIFFILGMYVMPWLTSRVNSTRVMNKNILEFVKKYSDRLKIRVPEIYLVENEKPEAYTFTNITPRVYISNGMFRMLNKKEIEAVILHEMSHIKNNSSLFKFSKIFINVFSPMASFSKSIYDESQEEREADKLAVRLQKTPRYLNSAKRKISAL